MTRPLDARIEVARGELVIGDLVVPMSVEGAADVWRVGGPAGPLLRSLGYGERTRLCALAAMSVEPRASLAAAVARAATVSAGDVDELVVQVAALLLCGAGDEGASFSATVLRVGRAAGWELGPLMDAQAADVDRLAVALGAKSPEADSGWNRLVFEASGSDASVLAVRDRLVDRLLARVDETSLELDEQHALVDAVPESAEQARTASAASASLAGDALTSASLTSPAPAGSGPVAAVSPATLRPALVISNRWSGRAVPTENSGAMDAGGSSVPASVGGVPGSAAFADAGHAAVAAAGPAGRAHDGRGHGGVVVAPGRGSQSPRSRITTGARRDSLGLAVASRSIVPAGEGRAGAAGDPWPARTSALSPRSPEPQAPAAESALERMAAELADVLASLLQDEADLRGVE